MVKPRVKETEVGIVGVDVTRAYDEMQRRLRDKGWLETDKIIKSGISVGAALEIGPGPGYLGLEWLTRTDDTTLIGLELSPDMKTLAEKNAAEYGLRDRVTYVPGNSMDMPFGDQVFDGVFSTGSLHEWDRPDAVLSEIARVLKQEGRFFIGDLRRDANPLIKAFMRWTVRPKTMRPGLKSSLGAAYTKKELASLLARVGLTIYRIRTDPFGLAITGQVG